MVCVLKDRMSAESQMNGAQAAHDDGDDRGSDAGDCMCSEFLVDDLDAGVDIQGDALYLTLGHLCARGFPTYSSSTLRACFLQVQGFVYRALKISLSGEKPGRIYEAVQVIATIAVRRIHYWPM